MTRARSTTLSGDALAELAKTDEVELFDLHFASLPHLTDA